MIVSKNKTLQRRDTVQKDGCTEELRTVDRATTAKNHFSQKGLIE